MTMQQICVHLRFVFSVCCGCIGLYRRAEQLKIFNSEFVRVPCATHRCGTSPHPPACGRRQSCTQAGAQSREAAHRRINILLKYAQLCGLSELCGEKRRKCITLFILNCWRRCLRYEARNLCSSVFICGLYFRYTEAASASIGAPNS